MLSFESDYTTGAHPRVLERLIETNGEAVPGYGEDKYTESAYRKIREACKLPNAQVRFITGGTQTNRIVISTMLKPYEGVIAAHTGHISCHEAGAIESSGHKVLQIAGKDGKLCAGDVDKYISEFYADGTREHMVFPGMVYISHPTEYGTLYTLDELKALSEVCRKYSIPLFLDGARLGYGLMSKDTDVTLPDIARLCDVFYIGGTKVGALCGEAIVFTKNNMPEHFIPLIKQQGALLAKGRVLGVQFDALFTDGLYFEIGKHAIELAEMLREVFLSKGYKMFIDSPTNQLFPILENEKMKGLAEKVRFSVWEKADEDHTVVRFATGWSTSREDIEALAQFL